MASEICFGSHRVGNFSIPRGFQSGKFGSMAADRISRTGTGLPHSQHARVGNIDFFGTSGIDVPGSPH